MSGTFEDLTVWQKSVQFAIRIYAITKEFPRDELYGMTSQLRRASVSIASNIAEGKGRNSDPDLMRFLATARGSLFEVRTQLTICEALGYLDKGDLRMLKSEMDETGRLLNGLMNAIGKRTQRREPRAAKFEVEIPKA
jgi:four helix bundle protein